MLTPVEPLPVKLVTFCITLGVRSAVAHFSLILVKTPSVSTALQCWAQRYGDAELKPTLVY